MRKKPANLRPSGHPAPDAGLTRARDMHIAPKRILHEHRQKSIAPSCFQGAAHATLFYDCAPRFVCTKRGAQS